ncbi:hypothetical protein OESDEN_01588 [Oesophagostomum dentatum]|uniref:Uncharacterized protein n=1 Tax=Oesophagostomum dentatum TaxID=61180 RepID=A0A0B1TSN6_OESDE|nr:hypothetical protein OESDEN_01588 [Oesophagostomum dentatum]
MKATLFYCIHRQINPDLTSPMVSNAVVPPTASYELDTEHAARKCCSRIYVGQSVSSELAAGMEPVITGDKASIVKNVGGSSLLIDPVLEQIERNRKIIEQLSPVLKYKEMMRKRRARAVPRRKFSIAQGYPRISRWKGATTSKCNSSGESYSTNLNW